jgi:choline dehydrogenase-like flavoprotein
MIYVVGSGPAGVSCAQALLKRGLSVTMLDAGVELEPDRKAIVEEMQASRPEQWKPEHVQSLREHMSARTDGIPLKYVYGSDFPYREGQEHAPFTSSGVATLPSMARGGLSNVWGAGILPYRQVDIADWPVSLAELEPHYEAVLSTMEFSGARDRLETLFPLYRPQAQALDLSRQAASLLEDLDRNAERLGKEGIFGGRSRLAVRPHPAKDSSGCVYCGLCMYGCPYGLIFNAGTSVDRLLAYPSFRYQPGIVVERVEEEPAGVNLHARRRDTGEATLFRGARAFLGCGVIPTTRILLESMNAFDTTLVMKDSQYFLLPLLRFEKTSAVDRERLHTLSQVYLEVLDRELSENTIHLQVYSYNDLLKDALRKYFGFSAAAMKVASEELLGRMMVMQGYLHSNLSPGIEVRLERAAGRPRLILTERKHPRTLPTVKALARKLTSNRRQLRAVPMMPLLKMGEAGRGFHSGGTFPMRESPGAFECDPLGRPSGFERVHAVDATTFPSIAATTITLTVMANAHRIGSLAADA